MVELSQNLPSINKKPTTKAPVIKPSSYITQLRGDRTDRQVTQYTGYPTKESSHLTNKGAAYNIPDTYIQALHDARRDRLYSHSKPIYGGVTSSDKFKSPLVQGGRLQPTHHQYIDNN